MTSVVALRIDDSHTLREAAVSYAQMGWRVFPLKPRDKTPQIRGWKQNATTDQTQINKWWHVWPEANIGLVTGKENGIFVVDVDGDLGADSLDAIFREFGPLPETSRQSTANGFHLFFKTDRAIKTSAGTVKPGIDIRGDGGYIVAAPSVHPSGEIYTWTINARKIKSAPEWLLNEIARAKAPVLFDRGDVPQGKRNDTLFRHGMSLKSKGEKNIAAQLIAMNIQRCKPPLPDSEVQQIVFSIADSLSKSKPALFKFRDFIRSDEMERDPVLRIILHEISFYMPADGLRPAWPTIQQIAEGAGVSTRTVDKKLKHAIEKGYIVKKRVRRSKHQKWANNVYMIPPRFLEAV